MNNDSPRNIHDRLARLSRAQLASVDIYGRTILHLLVLANQPQVLKSLLRNSDARALASACDYENGWTPFHYAVYYKRLACLHVLEKAIKDSDAIFKIKDRAGYTPKQLWSNNYQDFVYVPRYIDFDGKLKLEKRWKTTECDKPTRKVFDVPWDDDRGGSHIALYANDDIYHNLVIKPQDPTQENDTRYRQYLVSKRFQAAVLADGIVYDTLPRSKGDLSWHQSLEDVEVIAISNNHILAVTADNVYGWGLNSYNQLGFTSTKSSKNYKDIFEATPTKIAIKTNQKVLGVACSKVHSLVFTENEIWTFGLNIGQMGSRIHDQSFDVVCDGTTMQGRIESTPVSMSLRDNIKLVATSELCMVVVTTKNDIHVYHLSQHHKLPKLTRSTREVNFDLFKPGRLTRSLNIIKVSTKSKSFAAVLTDTGDVYSFNPLEHTKPKYTALWRAHDHTTRAVDFDISTSGSIVVCTRNGFVFRRQRDQKKWTEVDQVGVVKVSCDGDFERFGFVFDSPDPIPVQMAANSFAYDISLLSPLAVASGFHKQVHSIDGNLHNSYISETSSASESDDYWVHDRNSRHTQTKQRQPQAPIQSVSANIMTEDVDSIKARVSNNFHYKHFDWTVKLDDGSELGVHHRLIEARNPKLAKVLNLNSDEIFVEGAIKGTPFPEGTKLAGVSYKPFLILLHQIYADETLSIWSECKSTSEASAQVKDLKSQYESLQRVFPVQSLKGKGLPINNCGDLEIKTSNGALVVDSFILASRLAYFETALSSRWNKVDSIDWSDVSMEAATIIIHHLYGRADELLNDDDINILLEVVEVADEIMLPELQRWAESRVTTAINHDNYMDVLVHAAMINAQVIFTNCCWFVYHHLALPEVVEKLEKLDLQVLKQVEECFALFDKCQMHDFVDDDGEYNTPVSFLEEHPEHLSLFVADTEAFNELYISDARGCLAFEPLIDVPPKKRRGLSRGSKASRSDVAQFREAVAKSVKSGKSQPPNPVVESSNSLSRNVSGTVSPASSIASNSTRKDSPPPPVAKPKATKRVPLNLNSIAVTKTPVDPKTTLAFAALQLGVSPFLQSWASPSPTESSSQIDSKVSIDKEKLKDRSKPKAKIGPIAKLSQKQRKRLNLEESISPITQATPISSNNPWQNSAPSTEKKKSTEKRKISHDYTQSMPVLGSSSSSSPKLNGITLAEVMVEQTLKLENGDLPQQQKSLAEIQQEEEFARWWEQESKRVQKELEQQQQQQLKRKPRRKPKRQPERGSSEDQQHYRRLQSLSS